MLMRVHEDAMVACARQRRLSGHALTLPAPTAGACAQREGGRKGLLGAGLAARPVSPHHHPSLWRQKVLCGRQVRGATDRRLSGIEGCSSSLQSRVAAVMLPLASHMAAISCMVKSKRQDDLGRGAATLGCLVTQHIQSPSNFHVAGNKPLIRIITWFWGNWFARGLNGTWYHLSRRVAYLDALVLCKLSWGAVRISAPSYTICNHLLWYMPLDIRSPQPPLTPFRCSKLMHGPQRRLYQRMHISHRAVANPARWPLAHKAVRPPAVALPSAAAALPQTPLGGSAVAAAAGPRAVEQG